MSNISSSSTPARQANQSPQPPIFEMPLYPGHSEPAYSPLDTRGDRTSEELAALRKQQNKLSEQLREQDRISHERFKGLQYQLERQAQQHQSEIRRLSQRVSQNPVTQMPATQMPATQISIAQAQTLRRPKVSLQGIPTTYELPARSQPSWFETTLSAVPAFVWLMMIGMGMAIAVAIAIAPNLLMPSLGTYLRTAIPAVFIVGLVGMCITAVWDTFSQKR